MAKSKTISKEHVTRDDIEAKFRQLRGDVGAEVEQARGYAVVAGAIALTLLVIGAYWSGKNRGKKRATLLEIRRL